MNTLFLYHVTRKRHLGSIIAQGLLPKKPVEWRRIIPPKWRNREIVWLQGKASPRSRRWSIRLKIDTLLLESKHLHRLHKLNREDNLEWWFYVGTIPPVAIK